MKKGKVKFFNETKNFGFIEDHETGQDVFVHTSGCVDSIQKDDEVTFETKDGKKGVNAVNVQLAQ